MHLNPLLFFGISKPDSYFGERTQEKLARLPTISE